VSVKPNAWSSLWRIITRFERNKITPWLALRNSIGVGAPLIAGILAGSVPIGLALATGALNVAFSDSHDPYLVRARRMFAASVLVALAVLSGGLSAHNDALSVVVAGSWALAAGMLVALSTSAADLGVISLVTLVVFAASPQPVDRALHSSAIAFLGGLSQMLLSLFLWPLRRYTRERQALGDLFVELAGLAGSTVPATEAPPVSAAITQAQLSLAWLNREHTVDSERYLLLLSQAERMRLSLITLSRLRARLRRESEDRQAADVIGLYLEHSASVLTRLGGALRLGEPPQDVSGPLRELQDLAERVRAAPGEDTASISTFAMIRDARFQMDAFAGQLRAALDLAAYATPDGLAAYARREASKPWTLRLAGTIATLRANIGFGSAAFRHAIRLATSVAAGDALAHALSLHRTYWLPMTVAIVLKPDFTATFSRGVLRLLGTLTGLLLATGLFHLFPSSLLWQAVLITLLMFVLRCFGAANYGLFVTPVTALVVLLIAITGVSPGEVMLARGLNTFAGGAIALVAYWVWPTWERTQVPEALAQLLDAYRAYFRAIHESYADPGTFRAHQLDRCRMAARLARSNLEASIDRLSAEPGTTGESLRAFGAILASSHRLVQAMMSLEAGLLHSHPVPARPAFRAFANHVELTLYYLAAALRGSPLESGELPDLREDHHALVHSGDRLTERYALVNVETDRITNSLNTLSREILELRTPAIPVR
jgi:uncharacterized membrane protein YccC